MPESNTRLAEIHPAFPYPKNQRTTKSTNPTGLWDLRDPILRRKSTLDMEDRTLEQRKADEALEDAIKKCQHAYHDEDREFLLTEYIVLTANMRLDEGQEVTSYGRMYRNNDMPWHRILGLLEIHRTLVKDAVVGE